VAVEYCTLVCVGGEPLEAATAQPSVIPRQASLHDSGASHKTDQFAARIGDWFGLESVMSLDRNTGKQLN
jgi:hypothetical protein